MLYGELASMIVKKERRQRERRERYERALESCLTPHSGYIGPGAGTGTGAGAGTKDGRTTCRAPILLVTQAQESDT